MNVSTPPIPEPLNAEDAAAQARRAVLLARHGALEKELEAAPFHRVGTYWWEERTKEMSFLKHRLGN